VWVSDQSETGEAPPAACWRRKGGETRAAAGAARLAFANAAGAPRPAWLYVASRRAGRRFSMRVPLGGRRGRKPVVVLEETVADGPGVAFSTPKAGMDLVLAKPNRLHRLDPEGAARRRRGVVGTSCSPDEHRVRGRGARRARPARSRDGRSRVRSRRARSAAPLTDGSPSDLRRGNRWRAAARPPRSVEVLAGEGAHVGRGFALEEDGLNGTAARV